MATTWTDPSLSALVTRIKTVHITELRTAVNTLEGKLDKKITAGTSQPSNPNTNDLWIDTN